MGNSWSWNEEPAREGVLILIETEIDHPCRFVVAHCTTNSIDQTVQTKLREYPDALLVGKLIGFEDSHITWDQFVSQTEHVTTLYSRFGLAEGYTIEDMCDDLVSFANVECGTLDQPMPGECDTGILVTPSAAPEILPITPPIKEMTKVAGNSCRLVILGNPRFEKGGDDHPYIIMCTTEERAETNLLRLRNAVGNAPLLRSFEGLSDARVVWKKCLQDLSGMIQLEPNQKRQFKLAKGMTIERLFSEIAERC